MNKIKGSIWDSLTLPEKTVLYFKRTGCDYIWQSRWWNNWQYAFMAFRDEYVDSTL